jgi:hypothetical protein
MSPSTSMRRRRFLAVVLWSWALGLCRPPGAGAAPQRGRVRDPAAATLADVWVRPDSAAIVGREYLRHAPGEANAQVLLGLIGSTWPGGAAELRDGGTERFRDSLRRQQREDFEHGRVVNVGGWVLSVTEARLCALAALG